VKELAKAKDEKAASDEWNYPSFASSLELMYAQAPKPDRVLKDVAISTAASHIKDLVNSGPNCVSYF